MNKILLVDDDVEVLQLNRKFLEKAKFIVFTASDAMAGEKIIREEHPDCIVLDVMMPEVNGFTACQKYRTLTKVPIIFLTGCITEEDKIKGFRSGGDDYLEKPYSIRELCVRIQANIRRHQSYNQPATQSYGDISIDGSARKAFANGEELPLSNREYDLLLFLIEHVNETVSFEDIGQHLLGKYEDSDRRFVMVNISRLRKKLEDYCGYSDMIETVWSKGYKFISR